MVFEFGVSILFVLISAYFVNIHSKTKGGPTDSVLEFPFENTNKFLHSAGAKIPRIHFAHQEAVTETNFTRTADVAVKRFAKSYCTDVPNTSYAPACIWRWKHWHRCMWIDRTFIWGNRLHTRFSQRNVPCRTSTIHHKSVKNKRKHFTFFVCPKNQRIVQNLFQIKRIKLMKFQSWKRILVSKLIGGYLFELGLNRQIYLSIGFSQARIKFFQSLKFKRFPMRRVQSSIFNEQCAQNESTSS